MKFIACIKAFQTKDRVRIIMELYLRNKWVTGILKNVSYVTSIY